MLWSLFLVLHLFGLVSYNLILRKSILQKFDRLTLATIMQTSIAIPIVVVALIKPPHISAYHLNDLVQITITAALVVCLHITNVKALQYLEASVYSILYNLRILFTTVMGVVFLSEKIVPLQIAGGLLIFLGILTIRQKGRESLTFRGIQWGIAASIVISFLNLNEKELISRIGFVQYTVPVMLSAAIVMWAVLILRKQKIDKGHLIHPQTLRLMVVRACSAYGFTLAFNAGAPLSVGTYISSLSVIIIVILGVLLLGERDYLKHKIIATGFAVAGLTAILIAHLR